MRAGWAVSAFAVLAVLMALAACEPSSAPGGAANPGVSGIRFLAAGDARGFERAVEPRPFEFPRDHGSHPRFRTEWWYFVGNLHDSRERHFGFELTFFRIALSPAPRERVSAWATNQVWMAHFALTDPANDRFVAAQRFGRGALGLAGATSEPLRVWLEDWSAEGNANGDDTSFRLAAANEGNGLDLLLSASQPPVPNGDDGLDAKGPEPGNASYYYSVPRLEARGRVRLPDGDHDVAGLAWMDHEWGTSALSAGLAGWDWFGLQLSDGRDLMFYRLRRTDGTASEFSGGSLIDEEGRRRALGPDDVRLEVLGHWQSKPNGARYPIAWRLAVPGERIELEIEPYVQSQEIDLAVRYWEGAVRATGSAGQVPLTGSGYLELTGY